MEVTAIKQQLNRSDRFSIFIDGEYSFALGSTALLDSKLVKGQELSSEQLDALRKLSAEDALHDQAVRYASLRLHSRWEMRLYLERKGASPTLADSILNTLSKTGLVDDARFAEAFVSDRQRLRPTSRRKMILELQQKHITEETIKQVFDSLDSEAEVPADDLASLRAIIASKRKQSRYQDDLKLMQYLARQGFSYGDIKAALSGK